MSIDDLRAALAAVRAEAVGAVAARRAELEMVARSADVDGRDDEHDPDGATVAFEYALAAGVLRAAEAHLVAVDQAMDRLEAGTYGVCGVCGGPIGPERLAVQPAAVSCVECARGRRSGGIRRRV